MKIEVIYDGVTETQKITCWESHWQGGRCEYCPYKRCRIENLSCGAIAYCHCEAIGDAMINQRRARAGAMVEYARKLLKLAYEDVERKGLTTGNVKKIAARKHYLDYWLQEYHH